MVCFLRYEDAVAFISQLLGSLCLNNLFVQDLNDRGALKCFVNFFMSKTYLWALASDTHGSLSSTLDDMMRHATSLRGPGVDVLI